MSASRNPAVLPETNRQTNKHNASTNHKPTNNQPRKHHRSSVSKLSFDIIRDTNHPDTLAPTHAQVHLLAPFHATPTSSPLLYNTPHLQEHHHTSSAQNTLSGKAVAAFAATENASSRRLDFRRDKILHRRNVICAIFFPSHTAWISAAKLFSQVCHLCVAFLNYWVG